MELAEWHIWIIAAILLFIIEIFTPGFLTASLAIGCIAAGITSALDFGLKVQLFSFSVGTLIAFFGIRPFILKYGHGKKEVIKTNTEALIGKAGRVVVTIDNAKNEGRVLVEGDDWKAEAQSDQLIEAGQRVQVVQVNSTILIVKPLN